MAIEQTEVEKKSSVGMKDVKINIDEETLRELTKEIDKNIENVENTKGCRITKCKICGKVFKKRNKASIHIEKHLDQFTFDCEYCSKTMKTRNGLRGHILYNHTKKNSENELERETSAELEFEQVESVEYNE